MGWISHHPGNRAAGSSRGHGCCDVFLRYWYPDSVEREWMRYRERQFGLRQAPMPQEVEVARYRERQRQFQQDQARKPKP